MSDARMWVLLEVGCAECGDWPLVVPHGTYETSSDAADAAGDITSWRDHPSGGFIAQWGSGAWWIAPAEVLSSVGSIDLSIWDEPKERAYP